MSFLPLPSQMKQSPAMRLSLSCKPSWLKSNAYEFPNYSLFHPNLKNQVALILYYAHVMDQKKLLKDFFRLCKNSFENKYERQSLESVVKTWIRQSIVKLHRRREQIISNAVTTFQIETIRTISRTLIGIFWDILRQSSDKVSCCGINSLSKKLTHGAADTNLCSSRCFSERRTSYSEDISACISEWGQWFRCLPFQENKNLALSVAKSNQIDWLRKFWLSFCYQPDPTNSIHYGNTTMKRTTTATETTFAYGDYVPVLDQTSENHIRITITDFNPSCIAKLTERNLKSHNKKCRFEYVQVCSLVDADTYDFQETSTSTWSQENSESSGSWSVADFEDEMPEDIGFNTFAIPPGISQDQCNSSLLWMQSSSSNIIEADFDSDDESIIFDDVITEENCLERGETNGSLYFVDTDDDDDFDIIFSETPAVSRISFQCFEDKSQGYDNPCFEEEVRPIQTSKYMRTINESWNEMMLKTEDKPRKPSKVSFAPESSLVTIHCFEKSEDNSYDPSAILDRMRFQRRIYELNCMLEPFFTCEHRKIVEQRNCFYQV